MTGITTSTSINFGVLFTYPKYPLQGMAEKCYDGNMYTTRNLIRDIWPYIRPYRRTFWLATCARAASDLSWLYLPYALAVIINFFGSYKPGQALTPLYWAFGLSFVAAITRQLGMYLAKTSAIAMGEQASLDAQQKAVKHLMLLDMSWHEKESVGNKFKRIDRGIDAIDRIIRIWIYNFIEITINLAGITLIFLKFDLAIGITVSAFLVVYYLLARHFRHKAVLISDVVNAKEEHRSGIIFEAINNIRSVKVMSMSGKILKTLKANAADLLASVKQRIFWFQTGGALRNTLANIFRLCVMAYIAYGILQGRYQIGFLVLFVTYFGTILTSIAEFTDVSEDFAVAKNAYARLQAILDTPITIDDETGKVKIPADWQTLRLKDISFSYDRKKVLDRLSFEVKRGEKLGIVGLSGAGKSTLFKLLLKEHESYQGEISFDHTPLKTIGKKDYFNHLAVVLQDTELFNASLRDNITITNQKQERNKQLLDQAIEIAHVGDFMSKLPKGLNSIIGEKGTKLSGGEKQRVGLARAVFKQPQILLLDEATSHLDIESEKKIQDSLHRFFQNVTAIVIAHRLTTIKEMDRIIVIEKGRVSESGSFAELYAARGRFYELWEKQKI